MLRAVVLGGGALCLCLAALSPTVTQAGNHTCTDQKKVCTQWCQKNRPNVRCFGTCKRRHKNCMKTGIYEWTNSPDTKGLKRQ